MALVRRLADQLLEDHPKRAAAVVEQLGIAEAQRLLKRRNARHAAAVLRALAPGFAKVVLAGIEPDRAAAVLAHLDLDVVARLLRPQDPAIRQAILEQVDKTRAHAIGVQLGFPAGSAGGLMDAEVLALPQDLSAREAMARVRKNAEHARYNVYIVDRDQRLVGVLNLRELLIARQGAPLSDVMVRSPHSIRASADRTAVLEHPGWQEAHSLPVVDDAGTYLGAIRYRTLRELERRSAGTPDSPTVTALGQLFATGLGGLLDALTAPAGADGGESGR